MAEAVQVRSDVYLLRLQDFRKEISEKKLKLTWRVQLVKETNLDQAQ